MPLTKRELFEKCAAHLLRQGERSIVGSACRPSIPSAYRGNGELQCPIGVLIAPVFYSADLEGQSVSRPDVQLAVERSIGRALAKDEITMLKKVQKIHDNRLPQEWPAQIECLRNLTFKLRRMKNRDVVMDDMLDVNTDRLLKQMENGECDTRELLRLLRVAYWRTVELGGDKEVQRLYDELAESFLSDVGAEPESLTEPVYTS
jgi:hypothetical protein